MNVSGSKNGVVWFLEVFRESDELLDWRVSLDDVSRASLGEAVGIDMSGPGSYELSARQAKVVLEKFYRGSAKEFDLDEKKYSFFVADYAKT
ncbi:hypothetical protein BAY61_20520 [Prauserella marina]|uniref:Uncharacterized protein n=1 Tax=Prauserella marina TaxID=530584 RepID=A0A222VST3_9PSEU|nr:hypothetical protein [Prauserella marina]ASR36968.1 hypothetical protein BAY61_20520 [Prauserella marina]PWV80067.1 hypothetical protein DES30_103153 [Prauserella marina]SDD83931.1 hypothetical protein SAMN05421630_11364 [Prauserella marina]